MSKFLLIINGAALTGCAFFVVDYRAIILTALLLFLPLLDRGWQCDCLRAFKYQQSIWLFIAAGFVILLGLHNDYLLTTLSIIFLTALPEEWFFRGYFMQRLQDFGSRPWLANVVSSLLFMLLHIPSQGGVGLLVFFPSLLFGYVYQYSRNLIVVVLLHALANLFFIIYIRGWG